MAPLALITQPPQAVSIAQSSPVPHAETSSISFEEHSPMMDAPSIEFERTRAPWFITPDSLIVQVAFIML